jgi:voltage-gated potassium channel
MGFRTRTWVFQEIAKPGDTSGRAFDVFILSLIFLNVFAVVIGRVPSVQSRCGVLLHWVEVASVAVFTVEYLGRLWSCVTVQQYRDPIRGRLRFALRPMSIVDLLAFLPFYLPFLGLDLRFIRVLRLMRVVRLAKVGRYYSSLNLIGAVFRNKKEELALTAALTAMLLIVAASLMYHCENAAQPEKFSSIPATLWWAVVTVTNASYGDDYPITISGKVVASIIAILGVGTFALPTGIIGAGFVEELQKKKSGAGRCPHCGKEIL